MIWIWAYLGGAAVWLFVTIALSQWAEDNPRDRAESIIAMTVLAPFWPFGVILFAATVTGQILRR